MMDQQTRDLILDPQSEGHRKVLEFCVKRIDAAERHWSQRTDRWREAERLYRAYRPADEQDRLTARQPLTHGVQKIIVPYTYATIQSMLAFFMTVLTERRPVIPVEGVGPQDVEPAILMEAVLDYQWNNMDPTGGLVLYQWLLDALRYGVGIVKNVWTIREWPDVVRSFSPMMSPLGGSFGLEDSLQEQDVVAYEGNEATNISPFDWFPDPSRPMGEFQKGEFVFHRMRMSRTQLAQREAQGLYQGVDDIPARETRENKWSEGSDLAAITDMSDVSESTVSTDEYGKPYVSLHEGYIFCTPDTLQKLGLPVQSTSRTPRLWVFTLANKQRVVRAEPANLPGRCFPYAVFEPNFDLHSPSNVGIPENIRGLDYHISWLYNSRMQNVRKTLNNEWVVDPSLIESSDLSDSQPGRMVRLAKTAWGSGLIDKAVFPLPVTDVTANHHNDARITQELGETVTGANRLIMGMSNTGRRAATEVQGQLSLASGRMKMLIELFVSQGMRPWAMMQSKNTQAFLEQSLNLRIREQYAGIVGADVQITPDLLQGNFVFPIGEGGMPNDKQFSANFWREMFTIGVQSGAALPALQAMNWMMIAARAFQVAGVKDIRNFIGQMPPPMPTQMQVMPDAQMQQQAQQGNIVPSDGFPLPSPNGTPNVGMNGMGQMPGDPRPLQ